jgi:hypothetical protein
MVRNYIILFTVIHLIIFYFYIKQLQNSKIYKHHISHNITDDDNIFPKEKLLKLKNEHHNNIIYENEQFNKYITMETLRVKQKILYVIKNTKKRINKNPNLFVNDKIHIFNLKNDDLEDENMEMACDIIHKNLLKIFIDSDIVRSNIRSKGRHQHLCYFIFKW